MLHAFLVTLAVLPACILGWYVHTLIELSRFDQLPSGSPRRKVLPLLMTPWLLLVMFWAAFIAAMQNLSTPHMIAAAMLLYVMIALSLTATTMQVRRQLPKWVRSVRKRIDKLDKRLYERLP